MATKKISVYHECYWFLEIKARRGTAEEVYSLDIKRDFGIKLLYKHFYEEMLKEKLH